MISPDDGMALRPFIEGFYGRLEPALQDELMTRAAAQGCTVFDLIAQAMSQLLHESKSQPRKHTTGTLWH